jgi:hypothetical protein
MLSYRAVTLIPRYVHRLNVVVVVLVVIKMNYNLNKKEIALLITKIKKNHRINFRINLYIYKTMLTSIK